MTRNIRALNRGRYRVWWLTHSTTTIRVLQLGTIVLALGMVGRWDYEDQLAAERSAHEDVKRILAERDLAQALPPTVYVLEAATPEKAREKLARIAGNLDVERGRLMAPAK